MKNIILYIVGLITILNLPSCISVKDTNYLQSLNIPYPFQKYEEYRLLQGDMIRCSMYTKDSQFSNMFSSLISSAKNDGNIFLISENGNITLPFFGDIKLIGYTQQEAEEIIQMRMRESIKDIQVKISLYNNNWYILSASGQRGRYPILKENMTIYQALAIAGQPSGEYYDLSKVKILRKNVNGESYIKTFDLRTQDVIQSEFYYVKPNDLYYFEVDRRSFFDIRSFGSLRSFITTFTSLAVLIFSISI